MGGLLPQRFAAAAADRRVRWALAGLLVLGVAAHGAYAEFHLGKGTIGWLFRDWIFNAVLVGSALVCLARAAVPDRERGGWLALGIAISLWAAANVYYTAELQHLNELPVPSISDALWLAFYPASYVGLVLLARAHIQSFRRSFWLDGLVGALAVGAIGAALILPPIVAGTGGSVAAVATTLAYPLADLLLLALVVGVMALSGWRAGLTWTLIAGGLVLNAVADSVYVFRIATDTYDYGTFLDTLWPAGMVLIALGALRSARRPRARRLDGWSVLLVPTLFALGALGLLIYGNFHRLNLVALVLATATLVVAIARMLLTFRELRLLATSREQALTDELTGLGNRRALMGDLERALRRARPSEPLLFALLDLDGFKTYNDTFGHPEGDLLLARLSDKLSASVGPDGRAYRLGGDEFCILVKGRPEAEFDAIARKANDVLAERGSGFEVTSCFGAVVLPREAGDPVEALKLADQRMYRQKDARPSSARWQTREVLIRVLSEQHPDVGIHLSEVADLTMAVGRRMGMHPEDLDDLARAAELHDIGKIAIPDAILNKPGPLDDAEWEFMHRHTIIGEQMLAAAPALVTVGRLVRASHERWDGKGYPDGKAGAEIPLGARIVAVCDSYDAMVSDRPYRKGMSKAEALAELRRCAGTQFDPMVVKAFCEEIEAKRETPEPEADRVRVSARG